MNLIQLRELVDRGESENSEFKEGRPFAGDFRLQLIRTIAGMANIRNGGHVVIGVSELGVGKVPTLQGMQAADAKQYDSTVVAAAVARHFEPEVPLSVIKLDLDDKILVVIAVPEFTEDPCVCIKEAHWEGGKSHAFQAGDIFSRSKLNQTCRASSEGVRRILGLALTKKRDLLLRQVHQIFEGSARLTRVDSQEKERQELEDQTLDQFFEASLKASTIGGWGLSLTPKAGFLLVRPEETLWYSDGMRAVSNSLIRGEGLPFPLYFEGDTPTKDESGKFLTHQDEHRGLPHRWLLTSRGTFGYFLPIEADYPGAAIKPGVALVSEYAFRNALFLTRFSQSLLRELNLEGDVLLTMQAFGCNGRLLCRGPHLSQVPGTKACQVPRVEVTLNSNTVQLAADPVSAVQSLVGRAFEYFGLRNLSMRETSDVVNMWNART